MTPERVFQQFCYGRYRPPTGESLTEKQRRVYLRLKNGQSIQQIGKFLTLSDQAVHDVIKNIRHKGYPV